jgi:O-antigen/teichoic acid export membrane protein
MRDILKAGAKVGLATLAGMLGWVVAGKILALQLGAAGVGLYGLLRQLLQNLTLVGSFNGQTSLVQGLATRPDPVEQLRFSGSVLRIQIFMAGALALLLLLGAPWLGPWLIPHPQGVVLLRWLALAMLVMVAQTYVIGLLNGHRSINELVKSQLWGPLAVLALVYPMVRLIQGGHPFGFVLMLAGPAAVITAVAARAAGRAGWLPALRGGAIHRPDAVGFFRMSAVLLLAGIVTTGTQFLQSWLVARRLGLAEAGQFWTAWTLSMTYVTLVLGSLGTYYMPSLSRLTEPEARRGLIRDYLRLCLLAMPILVALVIVFKPWIIRGMFSASLLPALKVMRWMLIGDLFKGVSWVLAFPMLAFSDMKWFFWTDVLFSLGVVGTAWVWLSLGGGIEGLGFLFMLLYFLYLPLMLAYVRIKHGFVVTWMEVGHFLGGVTLVGILSWLTWNDEIVRGLAAGVWLLLVVALAMLQFRGFPGRSLFIRPEGRTH